MKTPFGEEAKFNYQLLLYKTKTPSQRAVKRFITNINLAEREEKYYVFSTANKTLQTTN